jgi:hypothetical protein
LAYVGIYAAGAAHDEFGRWHYAAEGGGELRFIAPAEKGDYEIRLYAKAGEHTDENLISKVAFTVEGSEKQIPEPQPEPEPEHQPEPEIIPEPEPEPELVPEPEIEPEPELVPEPEIEPEPELIPEPELVPEPEPEPKIIPEPEPEPEIIPEPEPEPKPEPSIPVFQIEISPLTQPEGTMEPASSAITLDKSLYAPAEDIVVSVRGITAQMFRDLAYVGIYAVGAAHDEFSRWHYAAEGDGELRFIAPADKGDYEIRLYAKAGEHTDENLVSKVAFTVEDSAEPIP